MNSLFELYKTGPLREDAPHSQAWIRLEFSKGGAYFRTVGTDGTDLSVDYRQYAPPFSEFLKGYGDALERQKNDISWMGVEERVFVQDHPYLLSSALASGRLTDTRGKQVRLSGGVHRLVVRIQDSSLFTASLELDEENPGIVQPVDREHVYLNGNIYRVGDMGPSFLNIGGLTSTFPKEDLLPFLSLFFSHFPSVSLDYKGYRIKSGGELPLKPVLTFSSIDRDGFLHLQAGWGLNGYNPNFFSNYEASKAVSIVDGDECIYVHPILPSNTHNSLKYVRKILNRLRREHSLDYGYFQHGDTIAVSPRLGELLVTAEITSLSKEFLLYGTEHLARYRIKKAVPKIRLHVSSGFDFLESTCDIEIDGEHFTPKELLSAYRTHDCIPLKSGTQVLIDASFIARLERILKTKGSGNQVSLSFFDLPVVEAMIDGKITGPGYERAAEIREEIAGLTEKEFPDPGIQGTLRAYQEYGYKWLSLLGSRSLGCCLADDMGLGKTVQTIAAVHAAYCPAIQPAGPEQYPKPATGPSLLVLPKSLVFNWKRELDKFAPDLKVYVYYENTRTLEDALCCHIIITTYALLRNEIDVFKDVPFEFVILDEAQQIKNLSSQITRAVMLIKGRRRIAISGTPMENNLMELYSLFRFLNPPMFGSAAEFKRRYLNPIQKDDDEDAAEDLRRKIYPFILRRLKRDVAKDLPEKVEQILYVEMGKAQKDFYENRKAYYAKAIREKVEQDGFEQSQMFIFQALAELRQIATVPEIKTEGQILSAKRQIIMESIDDVCRNRHKAIIFSNYIGTLEYLAEDIEKLGYEYLFMSGATKDRMSLVEKFQTESRYQVFLMTLKTGGVGLTLTQAEYVYIVDPWWNIAAENQAIDRAHRIGQKHTVFAYKLIAQDTIEERILTLQEQKRDLFNTVITNDVSMLKQFSPDDLNYIFS